MPEIDPEYDAIAEKSLTPAQLQMLDRLPAEYAATTDSVLAGIIHYLCAHHAARAECLIHANFKSVGGELLRTIMADELFLRRCIAAAADENERRKAVREGTIQ